MKHLPLFVALLVAVVFFVTACSGAGNAAGSLEHARSQAVQITETDFRISSSVTSFSPGQIYHFIVTNQGKTAHEFMIMPRSESSMNGMSSMEKMDAMALVKLGNMNPGETRTLDYAFPLSSANSRLEFVCYLPGHYEAGMKLD